MRNLIFKNAVEKLHMEGAYLTKCESGDIVKYVISDPVNNYRAFIYINNAKEGDTGFQHLVTAYKYDIQKKRQKQ